MTGALVHRLPANTWSREGRIELDIDARQARRQYRRARIGERNGLRPDTPASPSEARMVVIHTFCKAVG